MSRTFYVSGLTTLLSGCAAPYVVPPSAPTAEISAYAEHHSSSTNTRAISLLAFKDDECSSNQYGTLVTNSPGLGNKSVLTTPSNKILANERFFLTARYGDARFAQNRECYLTAAFLPEVNRRYKVKLVVNDEVTHCTMGIFDVTSGNEQQIDFSMPKFVCFPAGKTSIINGTPIWTNWQITVTTTPLR